MGNVFLSCFQFIMVMFSIASNFLATCFGKLATEIPAIPGALKTKVTRFTASIVETVHAVFMLPTLLRH